MKRVFIVFAIDGGKLVPHQHPVFCGDCAFDLGGEQEVQVCDHLNVREFTGVSEILTAIGDYNRQCSPDDFIGVGEFFVFERFTFSAPVGVKGKVKKTSSKSKVK